MKKKAIIAIVSLVVFGQGAWAQQPIDGLTYNSEGYYAIPDAAALNALATYVNAGNTCDGWTFKVTNDITFSQSESDKFVPIGIGEEQGEVDKPFMGIFDGNNKTISNITYIDEPGVGVGLFGYIYGGKIKNVTLTDCSFTGYYHVGGIVGNATGASTIENCQVGSSVTVIAKSKTKYDESVQAYCDFANAGGIIGTCTGENVIVQGCTSVASVSGDESVGGIAGWVYEGSLVNCNSSATVSGKKAVGGIAGRTEGSEDGSTGAKIYASITDCFYTGESSNVSGTSDYGIIVGEKGDYSTLTLTSLTSQLTLLDNDTGADINNANLLIYYNGAEGVDVTLSGRTLYRDGGWNTICLPFDVSKAQMDATTHPLHGATIKQLDTTTPADFGVDGNHKSGIENGCLYLNFAEATSIMAGVPYIIKWGKASDHPDTHIIDPKFEGVTINANASTEVSFTGGGSFVGTYNAKRFTTADLGQYLIMGGGDTLYYPGTGAGVGACRAYFYVPGINNNIKMFNLNFSDYSATTKITNTNLTDQTYEDGEWWTLSGMKLNGKPSEKGVYLFNGKKVVIQ